MNSYLTKLNVLSFLILLILLLAIPIGLKLIQNQQNLRSKAAGAPIAFQGPNVTTLNGKQIFRLDDQGTPTVGLTLTSPFGAGNSVVNSADNGINNSNNNNGDVLPSTIPLPSFPLSSPTSSGNVSNSSSPCSDSQRAIPSGYAVNLVNQDLAIQADDMYMKLLDGTYSATVPGVQMTTQKTFGGDGYSIDFTITWPNTSARILGQIGVDTKTSKRWFLASVITPVAGNPGARGTVYDDGNIAGQLCQPYTNSGDISLQPATPDNPRGFEVHFKNLRMQPL